ncbi:MAG: HEPN domain-containing protein [Bacteroidetes bacterium]|nr:HEPN domain-containing protein [Bacteroidota bacterium]
MTAPADWITEARQRVEDARLMASAGRSAAAVSRLYYAAHAAVTAGLVARDIDLKTHAAAHMAFHNHVWRDGSVKRNLGRLWQLRIESDYHLVTIDSSDVEHWQTWTEEFIGSVEARL